MRIKIAFVQLLPGIDLDENLDIGKKACVEAKEKGADIALFPEMWSDGYYLPQDETCKIHLKMMAQTCNYVDIGMISALKYM